MKKIISLFVVAILVCSSFIPLPVTADQVESITSFVAMRPDQYEELVFLLTNGSDEDKQFAVDYIFDYYNGNTSGYSWDQNYSVALPDGTSELYGFVTYNDYFGLMSIRTVVPATMRGTPQYGYTWYTVDSDAATSLARSGDYTYEGLVTARIATTRELYIATAGNYTISEENALSLGFSLEVFEYSHTVGTTVYYRYYKTSTHIEYSPVKQG